MPARPSAGAYVLSKKGRNKEEEWGGGKGPQKICVELSVQAIKFQIPSHHYGELAKQALVCLNKPTCPTEANKAHVDQMSPKAPAVKLIRYHWFVFTTVPSYWLQDGRGWGVSM